MGRSQICVLESLVRFWPLVKIFTSLRRLKCAASNRDVNIALICEGDTAELVGQWVLVHVGFAMSIIDEDEAKATLDALRRMEYDVTSA